MKMGKKKKGKTWIWWLLIIIVALMDINTALISWIPLIGDIFSNIGNFVFEIIQLALIMGLIKSEG